MSRSRIKSKIHGITTAKSEKQDKRIANRRLRRAVKQKPKTDDTIFPIMREISDVWSFEKDGKTYYEGMTAKEMRK